jgi:hypothetical protein
MTEVQLQAEMPDHEHDAEDRVGRLVIRLDPAEAPYVEDANTESGARMAVGPCAVSGVSLTNYNVGPQGKGWGSPCAGNRSTVTLSNGVRGTCRSEVAELSTLIMNEALRRGYNIRQNDTGCYNCRKISGSNVWSNDAWALAWDINWQSNPYTSGRQHDIPDWLAKLFNRYGFAWGGDYTGSKRDYMHFEFMGSPSHAASATSLARRELSGVNPVAPPTGPDPNNFPISRNEYFGDIDGPNESHGGINDDEKTYIRWIQDKLTRLKFLSNLPGDQSGIWRQPTTDAMGAFQRANLPGTTLFGQCWWDDWKALFSTPDPTPPPPPPPTDTLPSFAPGSRVVYLQDPHMSGTDVQKLQNVLKAWYPTQPWASSPNFNDGDFGNNTDTAVRYLQSRAGLVVDGEAGPSTWRVLGF